MFWSGCKASICLSKTFNNCSCSCSGNEMVIHHDDHDGCKLQLVLPVRYWLSCTQKTVITKKMTYHWLLRFPNHFLVDKASGQRIWQGSLLREDSTLVQLDKKRLPSSGTSNTTYLWVTAMTAMGWSAHGFCSGPTIQCEDTVDDESSKVYISLLYTLIQPCKRLSARVNFYLRDFPYNITWLPQQ